MRRLLRCIMPWGSRGPAVQDMRPPSAWSPVPSDACRSDNGVDWLPCLGLASGLSPFGVRVSVSLCTNSWALSVLVALCPQLVPALHRRPDGRYIILNVGVFYG